MAQLVEFISNAEFVEIKKKLPSDAVALISEASGISKTTVYRFFNGKNVTNTCATKILSHTVELVKTQKTIDRTLKSNLEELFPEREKEVRK